MMWTLLALLTLAAALGGFLLANAALLSAWRFALTILTGLAAGSLILLAIGRLLANEWLDAVRDELEPASWTIAMLAILSLPLLLASIPAPGEIIPPPSLTAARARWFAADWMPPRLGCVFAIWMAAAALATARRESRLVSAFILVAAAAAFTVAAADWLMFTRPFWWSTLFPFAFLTTQLGASLAIAFIANLAQRERLDEAKFRSLASGLQALALLTLWVWFSQFLIAWYGNLPDAAGWHLARMGPGTPFIAGAGAAYLSAAGLLILFTRHRLVMLGASGLVLIGYLLGMIWLLRPARIDALSALDLAALAGLGALWLLWLVAGQRLYDAAHTSSGASNHGRSGGASGGQSERSASPSR